MTILTPRTALLCCAALVAPGFAAAQDAADRMAVIELSNALDAAVDRKDWDLARSYFTDEIEVAMGSPDAQAMPADELIGGWETNLYEGKPSFHLRGGHVVTFDGPDAGTVESQGYAWNRIEGFEGGDLWEVWGSYTFDVVREADGWRLASFVFQPHHTRGNEAIPGHVPD
ncbi:nuclear transport factor 2 family protein [Jannaschia sp. Os4]|uniref:nuclear transport factor 2 family protein n=1 Tax=Jannaschia sp. Os4 TaxID=2807617 RepID=UPI001939D374|nr:nuclear transport factor 2 family protein [Jannaschia sp. Os4]MBM2578123.1 nuclear transport factor 2 family protein [Jannaschia sp. Os4]